MYSIGIIVPYFGKFPEYFPAWLSSAGHNKNIDFLIFTDNEETYDYPKNVQVTVMKFEDLEKKFQEKYDFKIALNNPYKLCDFKPAYGDIFSDELKNYDYFGYCDLDVIFGNIRKFITDEILQEYDKIFSRGHLCIIKNQPELIQLYKEKLNGINLYSSIFQDPENRTFDEKYYSDGGGINGIFKEFGKKIYDNDSIIADINIKYKNFHINSMNIYNKNIFIYNYGGKNELMYMDDLKNMKEYIYIHLQKRKMINNLGDEKNHFIIVPNQFISYHKEDFLSLIEQYNQRELLYTTYLRLRFKNAKYKLKKFMRR